MCAKLESGTHTSRQQARPQTNNKGQPDRLVKTPASHRLAALSTTAPEGCCAPVGMGVGSL